METTVTYSELLGELSKEINTDEIKAIIVKYKDFLIDKTNIDIYSSELPEGINIGNITNNLFILNSLLRRGYIDLITNKRPFEIKKGATNKRGHNDLNYKSKYGVIRKMKGIDELS